MSYPQAAVCFIGCVHVLFMIGELCRWDTPFIMGLVLRKWPKELDLSANDRHLVSMVVHNAGIYNGIVAVVLFASAYVGSNAYVIQVTLLVGVIVAGVFGAATLSKATIVQALLGAIALGAVVYHHP